MGLIFRPIRTILLLGSVFLAGVFFERFQMKDTCLDRGGSVQNGICTGVK
ncbi:hypothetical protein XMM379_000414 [Aliiroseovarius sp. xm-m-379]|nr:MULTISPECIES: hypothetical protein [unclassified Aliiroseovarius]NRP14257.1 hypothetical protein [Aliiroseovarius sp. xm-d-517]NRP23741.1 hypothetical protein [Aliiroseovarius sp. xm-m-379]NRP29012.1 hypothetical protein [Aliiroseovarius sp. xm-m-314]NRP32540.1 hypothetical protein [Aliiroseovarius sp. xm-a-104]NRP41073.1 hypothetical protein [Aliiroseovarius sp. xm-m-339-2]